MLSCSKDEDTLLNDLDGSSVYALKTSGNKAPVAVATATKTSGKAPMVVKFSSKSTDDKGIAGYSWDFGNGITGTTVKSPSRTLKKSIVYNVKLTVRDANGLTSTDIIKIDLTGKGGGSNEDTGTKGGLSAVAKASALSGKAPLVVKFSSASTDDKKVTGYSWDFGSGITPTTVHNPTRTLKRNGTYEVKLTVKDADGNTDTDIITINVGDNASNPGNSEKPIPTPTAKVNPGNYPSNAVFASSFGYNLSDATAAFEKAIKSGSSYVVIDKQSGDWIIRPTKFFDLRNMTIVFESGVVVRAKSGAFSSSSQLFQLVRAQNVTIEGSGATFKMNNGGKHALALNTCNGTTVRGLTLRESGADGIYIAGGSNSGSYSQNIILDNVTSTDNKRHGLTVISAQDVYIKNSKFLRSSGSTTEVGVDLEPNNSSDRLVNINFDNCAFEDNDSSGFVLGTRSLTSSSIPISVLVKNSVFRSNDRSPHSSRPRTQLQLSQGSHDNPVKGEIRFERVKFNQSNYRIIFSKLSAKSYKVVFKDCSAETVSTKGRDPVIELQSLGVAQTMGGFTFDNFRMEYNSDVPFMRLQVPSNDIVKDIRATFTIDEPNDNPLQVKGGYKISKNQNVSINYKHIN